MSVYIYSKTVGSNTTVGGQTVTDGVMVPSAVDNAFQGIAAEIAEYRDDTGGALATTGSANAYILATNATTVLADGASVSFVANHANTGAATINVDSLGVKAIRKENDQALVTGDILADAHYVVQYDESANSAAGAWLLINSTGYARTTHTHTVSEVMDAGALAALDTVGTSEIDANSVTLAELEHGTQGDVLYYGASGAPARLGVGTSGEFLKTQGAAANPIWALPVLGYTDYNKGGYTVSTLFTQAHGKGAQPALVMAYLECTTADLSYSIGDRVDFGQLADGNANNKKPTVIVDTTNVLIKTPSSLPEIASQTDNSTNDIDTNDWDIIIRVFD